MKKIFSILNLFSDVFACSQKTILSGNKEMNFNKSDIDMVSLSKGNVYEMKCGQCQELKRTSLYTNAQWSKILAEMMPKAKLNSEEKSVLIEFIQGHEKYENFQN